MILIGETLNSSIPEIQKALETHDEAFIVEIIKKQHDSGADYLDINTAIPCGKEAENMTWVLELVLKHSNCGIALDSANPDLILDFIPKVGNRKLIVNSVTQHERYDRLIAMAKDCHAGIVGLPLAEGKIPSTVDERLRCAGRLIDKLKAAGFEEGDVYIDALVGTMSFNGNAAMTALETVHRVKAEFPGVKTICGISNISYGLPSREKMNAAFLTMAMQNGLDCAILNLTAENTAETLRACDALLGRDANCLEYIKYEK